MPKGERTQFGYAAGFNLLDGVALVSGAAVAAVHVRSVVPAELSTFGMAAIWGIFSWVALSAAGPFVFVVRRFIRRVPEYPKVGDTLWALIGMPWLCTAVVRSAAGEARPQRNDAVAWGLCIGLAAVSLVSLGVVWRTWVTVSPEQAARTASRPWTNRLGLLLAVAWPVQCGLGLVMLD